MTRTSVRLYEMEYPHICWIIPTIMNYELWIVNYELPHDRIFAVLYQVFVSFAEMVAAEKATVGG